MSSTELMPVGEWIEVISSPFGGVFVESKRLKVICRTGKNYLMQMMDGTEFLTPIESYKWRYPIDPLEELEKRILGEWRTLDTQHDTFSDIPKQWLLEWMLNNGVTNEAT